MATPESMCPVCGDVVENKPGETAHLIACGVMVNKNTNYYCICGQIISGPYKTFAEDFNAHLQQVKHDWPRILTTKALERM